MRLPRSSRRGGGIRALLVAALALVGVGLLPGIASAAPDGAPTTGSVSVAEPDSIIPGTHRCTNFGSTNPAGYRAGHCADIDWFYNSLGIVAYRGQGQSFCQRASSGVIVQCLAIRQTVKIRNMNTGEEQQRTFTCGSYGGGSCPLAGRFQNLSPGIYSFCGQRFRAYVQTTLRLPGDGATQTSVAFGSNDYIAAPPC